MEFIQEGNNKNCSLKANNSGALTITAVPFFYPLLFIPLVFSDCFVKFVKLFLSVFRRFLRKIYTQISLKRYWLCWLIEHILY